MKKLLVLALTLMMLLSLAACGEKDPAPSGSGTTDPGTSQQTPSGQDNPGGTAAWPKNQFTDLIPKPESGTVFNEKAVDNAYFQGHTMTMTNWSLEDCKSYAEDLISAGFNKPGDGFDSVVVRNDDTMYSFGGVNEDGVYVTCGTSAAQKTGNISIQVKKEG